MKTEAQAMELPDTQLELVALLCKHMQSLLLGPGRFEGVLDESLDFDQVSSALDGIGLLESAYRESRKIEGRLPQGFFLTIQELLEAPLRRCEKPTCFYVRELDIQVKQDTPVEALPDVLRRYFQAVRFFGLLIKVADHIGGIASNKTCVFLLSSGKIEVKCEYTVDDLKELEGLDAFADEFIVSETHRAQKNAIIKRSLGDIFLGESQISFAGVLGHFANLVDKARAGYDLYMAEFSFQKVKEALDKEKLDAMLKLNKVFSDIQNQLLAVPAALVLIGGQMQAGGWSLKNMLIWSGALVFAILMNLLIRNQRHTLQAVKEEIDQQRQQLKSKYRDQLVRFDSTYQDIDRRYTHQRRLICTVDALVGLSFLGASFMLLWFSGAVVPAWNALLFLFVH